MRTSDGPDRSRLAKPSTGPHSVRQKPGVTVCIEHVPGGIMSNALHCLSDAEVLAHLNQLTAQRREVLVELLSTIAEVDGRRLYLPLGYASMFEYLTKRLGFSENEAYVRLSVARAARRYPRLLVEIGRGQLHLTGASLLVPKLTPQTSEDLLNHALGRSRREIEKLLATRFPAALPQPMVRKLPVVPSKASSTGAADQVPPCSVTVASPPAAALAQPGAAVHTAQPTGPAESPLGAPARPAVIQAVTADRYKLQVCLDEPTRQALQQLQDALAHTPGCRDMNAIVGQAIVHYLAHVQKRKYGLKTADTSTPPVGCGAAQSKGTPTPVAVAPPLPPPVKNMSQRPPSAAAAPPAGGDSPAKAKKTGSRPAIPRAIRREVYRRDGGQCTFVSEQGRRCEQTSRLEFDHRIPWAQGGEHGVGQLRLLCAAHNRLHAQLSFGKLHMEEAIARAQYRRRGTRSATGVTGPGGRHDVAG